MQRVYNFSPGPAMLPEAVLQRMQAELLDWRGSGMSVMEVSHRGADFIDFAAASEKNLRGLLGIPDADPASLDAEFERRNDGLWGVYRFKRGFGGQWLQSVGAYDYVYNPLLYQIYRLRRKQ